MYPQVMSTIIRGVIILIPRASLSSGHVVSGSILVPIAKMSLTGTVYPLPHQKYDFFHWLTKKLMRIGNGNYKDLLLAWMVAPWLVH